LNWEYQFSITECRIYILTMAISHVVICWLINYLHTMPTLTFLHASNSKIDQEIHDGKLNQESLCYNRISIFLLSTSFHIHQLHQLESWYNPTYLEHGCSFVNRWRLLYIGRPSSWVGSNDCSEEFSNSGKCSDTFLYICYIERALCTNNCTTFEQDLFICK